MQRGDRVARTQGRPLLLNLVEHGTSPGLLITAHNGATKPHTQQPHLDITQSPMLSDVGHSRSSTTGPSTPVTAPLSVTHWQRMMSPGLQNSCAALMRVNRSSMSHTCSK